MAASVITVVSMPAFDRLVAISCPWWKVSKEDKNYNYILTSKSTFFMLYLHEYRISRILMRLRYLAKGGTLRHDDMELAFARGIFEEGLHGARATNSHDDLVGVNVFQGLHRNVVSCSL